MESGDRWSMQKCAGGAHDTTIINRLMLRFRPIAPKPMNGELVSGVPTSSNKNLVATTKRTKRKYVRVCKKNNRKRRILDEAKEDNDGNNNDFATLQLMPEKADLSKSMAGERSWDLDPTVGNNNYRFQDMVAADHDMAMMGLSNQTEFISSTGRRVTVMESWVTAESVTETCMDEGEMRNCTDVEKMKNLEMDTCPGFISDLLNRVLWVNQAYKNMVGAGLDGGWEQAETTVRLVVIDGFIFPEGAFSCRVRLQYGNGKGRKYTKMVPCDVWRMRSGGLAWRLDLKAALSLGF